MHYVNELFIVLIVVILVAAWLATKSKKTPKPGRYKKEISRYFLLMKIYNFSDEVAIQQFEEIKSFEELKKLNDKMGVIAEEYKL